mmetsp:Transcript_59871/g.177468  ORF Transcript_59871/g.177468 Transcript_59871/m.177468 type:complete len:359 (-) Transcript_59871:910-1986(-)
MTLTGTIITAVRRGAPNPLSSSVRTCTLTSIKCATLRARRRSCPRRGLNRSPSTCTCGGGSPSSRRATSKRSATDPPIVSKTTSTEYHPSSSPPGRVTSERPFPWEKRGSGGKAECRGECASAFGSPATTTAKNRTPATLRRERGDGSSTRPASWPTTARVPIGPPGTATDPSRREESRAGSVCPPERSSSSAITWSSTSRPPASSSGATCTWGRSSPIGTTCAPCRCSTPARGRTEPFPRAARWTVSSPAYIPAGRRGPSAAPRCLLRSWSAPPPLRRTGFAATTMRSPSMHLRWMRIPRRWTGGGRNRCSSPPKPPRVTWTARPSSSRIETASRRRFCPGRAEKSSPAMAGRMRRT